MDIELFRLQIPGYPAMLPGDTLEEMTPEKAARLSRLTQLLNAMHQQYVDAVITLGMYEEAEGVRRPARAAWPAVFDQYLERVGSVGSGSEEQRRQQAMEAALLDGHMPPDFINRATVIHARSFVYSLDMIGKLLGQLIQNPEIPESVTANLKGHRATLEGLGDFKAVRDSIQHHEQRIQAKGRPPKQGIDVPIDTQPIDLPGFEAPAGIGMILGSFYNNRFISTAADGHLRSVEISNNTLHGVGSILAAIYQEFRWQGSPRPWAY